MAKTKQANNISSKEQETKKAEETKKAQTGSKDTKSSKGSKEDKDQSLVDQVKALLVKAGDEGLTANQIADQMGFITKDMEKAEKRNVLKKTRVLARKAAGGSASKRDGRQAIYIAQY